MLDIRDCGWYCGFYTETQIFNPGYDLDPVELLDFRSWYILCADFSTRAFLCFWDSIELDVAFLFIIFGICLPVSRVSWLITVAGGHYR